MLKRIYRYMLWRLGLTGQCDALYPRGTVRGYCQRRMYHPGSHDDHWTRW